MRNAWILTVAVIFIASCSKFEDGPAISFRSKENRLTGKWKLMKWTEKGEDVTLLRTDSNEIFYEFFKEKTLTYMLGLNQPIEGTWEMEDNYVIMDLQLVSEVGNYIDKDTLMLKRLTNKEMVVFYDNDLETELFFEAQ
jgi:hypothetical protein